MGVGWYEGMHYIEDVGSEMSYVVLTSNYRYSRLQGVLRGGLGRAWK
jgi:hypothetical protein